MGVSAPSSGSHFDKMANWEVVELAGWTRLIFHPWQGMDFGCCIGRVYTLEPGKTQRLTRCYDIRLGSSPIHEISLKPEYARLVWVLQDDSLLPLHG